MPLPLSGKIIDGVGDTLIANIKREFGYLIDYNTNIGNLKNERDSIQQSIERIQDKVDEAKRNGQIVYSDVEKWLTEAPKMKAKIDEFLRRSSVRSLDLVSRYTLSKEAVSMKNDLDTLKERSKFEIIARLAKLEFISSTDDFQAFTSRDRVFKEVMAALKDDHVNMVGIYGLGGVGKTTIAEEIGKQLKIKGDFDEFVMAVVSQNVVVRNIQGQLADKLGLNLVKETEDGRAAELRNRLKNGKKNLVILDDLWSKLEINKIGIPIAGDNNGCQVLLTSRNQRVFKDMNVGKDFSLGVLNDEEALHLFHNKMGNFASEIQESIIKQVCKECGGLPIALLAVAAALKDERNYEIRNDALTQLTNSKAKYIAGVDPEVYASLKLSYDLLRIEEAKECLLICCLFPEDAKISIDDLVRYGMGMEVLQNVSTLEDARNRVHMLVDALKASSLLLDGGDKNSFKMHDIIRDVVITIATDKKAFLVRHGAHLKEWPKKDACEGCTVISLRSENIDELPDGLECPRLRTLVLECPKVKISDTFISRMTQLRLLHVKARDLKTLLSSLKSLSSLRVLCLENCWLGDISLVVLKDLKSLEILSLVGSYIMELPSELKQLTHLRLLDLRKCCGLRATPPNVISNLTRLEELFISDSAGINPSLVELKSLVRLVALEIRIPGEDALLPNGLLLFDRLIRYKVCIGELNFCDRISFQPSNKALSLSDIQVTDDIKVLLVKAEYLNLENLKGFANVLHNQQDTDGAFFDTEYFHVRCCDDLNYLLGKGRWFSQYHICRSGSFFKLRELTVDGCEKMKYLFPPSVARALKQLQRLKVVKCKTMKKIITNESLDTVVFAQLGYLCLSNLESLRSFCPDSTALFNKKVAFPALEELELEFLSNTKIWDDSEKAENSFGNLRVLKVQSCNSLKNLIPYSMVSRLLQLERLDIEACDSIVSVVKEEFNDNADEEAIEIINFLLKLRTLRLQDLKSMKCLFGLKKEKYSRTVLVLSKLRELVIFQCPRWEHVVSSFVASSLVNLRFLKISCCPKMTEVVATERRGEEKEEAIKFPLLERLYLDTLDSMRSFCKSISKQEDTTEDTQAQPLFNHMVEFPALKELELKSMPNTQIWDDSGKLAHSNLTELGINGCRNLRNVVSSSVAIGNQAEENEEANHHIVVFPLLEKLCLIGLESLRSFCNSTSTREDTTEEDFICTQAQPLFNHMVLLPKLEECTVNGLDSRVIFGDSLLPRSFCNLRKLGISRCKNLAIVFPANLVPRLQNLRYLGVKKCRDVTNVFELERRNASGGGIELLPKLERLVLNDLPNLDRVWKKDLFQIISAQNLDEVIINGWPVKKCLG